MYPYRNERLVNQQISNFSVNALYLSGLHKVRNEIRKFLYFLFIKQLKNNCMDFE